MHGVEEGRADHERAVDRFVDDVHGGEDALDARWTPGRGRRGRGPAGRPREARPIARGPSRRPPATSRRPPPGRRGGRSSSAGSEYWTPAIAVSPFQRYSSGSVPRGSRKPMPVVVATTRTSRSKAPVRSSSASTSSARPCAVLGALQPRVHPDRRPGSRAVDRLQVRDGRTPVARSDGRSCPRSSQPGEGLGRAGTLRRRGTVRALAAGSVLGGEDRVGAREEALHDDAGPQSPAQDTQHPDAEHHRESRRQVSREPRDGGPGDEP